MTFCKVLVKGNVEKIRIDVKLCSAVLYKCSTFFFDYFFYKQIVHLPKPYSKFSKKM